MTRKLQVGILSLSLFVVSFAYAAPKESALCSPGLCVAKSTVPKRLQKFITKKRQPVGPAVFLKFKGKLDLPPEETNLTPNLAVPANRSIQYSCALMETGRMNCVPCIVYEGCPSVIIIKSPSGDFYQCDLDCGGQVVNTETGNCDCEVLGDTCKLD